MDGPDRRGLLARPAAAWAVVREAAVKWDGDNATCLSAALTFYAILSVAPLFVIAIAIAGAVFGREAATGALTDQLRGLLGDAGAEVAKTTVEHADWPASGTAAAAIGVVALLFGASGVFGKLLGALNTIWGVRAKAGRGVWAKVQDRFLSFGMVLTVGFLLLVSLVVSTALAAVGKYAAGLAPGGPALMQAGNFAVSLLAVAALFALIFKFLPDARVAWRDVWFGAGVTAALFAVGKYAIGLYLGRSAPGTPFGAAGSVVAFVVWVYYSGLIVFFGAELTQVVARRSGRAIRPAANAEPAEVNPPTGPTAPPPPPPQVRA